MMDARAFIVIATIAAAPAGAAGLRHDIFERPSVEALKPTGAAPVKTVPPSPPPVEWKPELRAIIDGKGGAMVNVEGRILQIGQEMDGYRLAEVHDRQATFVKDRTRYTLFLKSVRPSEAPPAVTTQVSDSAPQAPRGFATLKTSDVLSKLPSPDTVAYDRRRE